MNIDIINNEHYGCFYSCIASVAKTWKKEYSLMFTSSWGFKYKFPNSEYFECLGNRIGAGWHSPYSRYLNDYHGLTVNIFKTTKFSDILAITKKEVSNNYPVALFFDSYWCPWNKEFNKNHTNICFLVIDIDEKNNLFYCVDPSNSKNIKKLEFDEYKKCIGKFICFRENKLAKDLVDLPNPLFDATNSFVRADSVSAMRNFAKELESYNCFYEFKNFYLENVPILKTLKLIEDSRANMSEAISYYFCKQKQKDELSLSNEFLELAEDWKNLRMIILKLGITQKESNLIKALEILNQLIHKEEHLSIQMMKNFN